MVLVFVIHTCNTLSWSVRNRREINGIRYLKHLFQLVSVAYCKTFTAKICTSAIQVFFLISNQAVLELSSNNVSEQPRTNEVARKPNDVYPESSERGINLDPAV